ncbi:unnamed protein product [Larinioides sclopetarius]|uniref:Uncharacterized protein n=1 Tax=Larinioides sclopetarius TaxID=280406 RepID=A0AAV2BBT2_9ARAC
MDMPWLTISRGRICNLTKECCQKWSCPQAGGPYRTHSSKSWSLKSSLEWTLARLKHGRSMRDNYKIVGEGLNGCVIWPSFLQNFVSDKVPEDWTTAGALWAAHPLVSNGWSFAGVQNDFSVQ